MTLSLTIGLLLFVAVAAANLPWLSERFLLLINLPGDRKGVWHRLIEWLLLYLLVGAISIGLEKKVTGSIHTQDWEFFVVTFCLFLVFALPGFIYRHDLRRKL
jgi:hypothetical protein